MIDFDGQLVNPFNITFVSREQDVLSGEPVRVFLHLACGTVLSEGMTAAEFIEFESMLTELIMGEEIL